MLHYVQSSFAITILTITIILTMTIFPGQTKLLLHKNSCYNNIFTGAFSVQQYFVAHQELKRQQIAAGVKKSTYFFNIFTMFLSMSVHHTKMSHRLNKGVLLSLIGNGTRINCHIFLACDYGYTFHPLNDIFRYNNILEGDQRYCYSETRLYVREKIVCTCLFFFFSIQL